ncbi:MAG: efflux RND transporter periplasmic adaptor subunit, partial [Flavobacteriales bacterium]|nr:efflux RND transporter periplasmic adaptor subunit [Flavobacteriales bacterium]
TIPVHAHVEEGSHDLVEGMSVLADVPTGGGRLLAVPDGALARSGDVGYVYVDEGPTEEGGHRYRQVEVRPGLSRAGWTAVTPSEPLDSATAIAGDGVFYLRSTLTNSGEE